MAVVKWIWDYDQMLANHVLCVPDPGMVEDIRDERNAGDVIVICDSCKGVVGFIGDDQPNDRNNAH